MRLGRWLATFGRFWWEFIVGDTPEVALGVAVIVVAGWLIAKSAQAAAVVVVPLAIIALLAASLRRGLKAA